MFLNTHKIQYCRFYLLSISAFLENDIDGNAQEKPFTLTKGKNVGSIAQSTTTLQDYQFVYYKYSSGKTTEFVETEDFNVTGNHVTDFKFESAIVESLGIKWNGFTLGEFALYSKTKYVQRWFV